MVIAAEGGAVRIAEIMTRQVRAVAPELPADEAWELMRQNRIRHLVVLSNGYVVGVLSERDAGGKRGASLRAQSHVADLMTAHVATIESDATVRKAANLMRGRTIGCLPVIDGPKLVGIVTASDLLELVGRGHARFTHSRPDTANAE
jgi:acetoin utilization protein AcuB